MAITTSRRDSKGWNMFRLRHVTSRGVAQTKLSKGGSLFSICG